jgi:hypothetical protein
MMESGDSTHGAWIPVSRWSWWWYRGGPSGVISGFGSAATRSLLNSFRINYYLVESNEDGKRISTAFEEARATKRPVAVLIGDEYHGFNR